MSSLGYGAITRRRRKAAAGESTETSPPGLKPYVDTLAALVPAEVLAAGAAILTLTTETKGTGDAAVTTITDATAMKWSFWALLVISSFLYVLGRASDWEWWDLIRLLIPPAAFAGWAMVTHPSLFDVVTDWSTTTRNVIAILGTLVVGAIATALAYKVNAEDPPGVG